MITSLVKIARHERDTLEKVCATVDIPVNFFTIEENELMLLAEFTCPDPGQMFLVGRMLQLQLELNDSDKRIAKLG
jgi:hypothetical protein